MTDPGSRIRDPSLDIWRGLIVALMALDHVRIFFSSAQFDPVDLERTTAAYFLIRWITHLCAPGFFFIAGLGAALFAERAGPAAASRFLLTRGAFLVATEFLLFGLAWSFNPGWWWFGVIWGLGAAMILLAALLHAPAPLLIAGAAGFILFHNPFAGAFATLGPAADALLYSGGFASLPVVGERLVIYPVLPWLALMVLGYASARWLARDADPGGRNSLLAGATAVAAFALLRRLGFGEPAGGGFTAGDGAALLAFLNVEKYPPSLQFSLVTLGLGLLLLGAVRLSRSPAAERLLAPLRTFGRVPFFFYLLHLYAIHASALAAALLLGWPAGYLFWNGAGPKLVPPDGYGFGVPGLLAVWLLILALLLPPCAWFAALKRRRESAWLKLL